MRKAAVTKQIDPSDPEQLGEFLYERHRTYVIETVSSAWPGAIELDDGREPAPWAELRPRARKVWLKTAKDTYETFKPEAA